VETWSPSGSDAATRHPANGASIANASANTDADDVARKPSEREREGRDKEATDDSASSRKARPASSPIAPATSADAATTANGTDADGRDRPGIGELVGEPRLVERTRDDRGEPEAEKNVRDGDHRREVCGKPRLRVLGPPSRQP